jgi:DNA-3-methyladenine glycosylase I
METSNSYCNSAYNQKKDTIHKLYHDNQYGFPLQSDNELFGRLILEINQAGLSWDIILKKQENFRTAYSNFDIKSVANYNQTDINRLLNNTGIIRNKLKINAAIYNASVIIKIKQEMGSFQLWLDHHHPKTKDQWVKLFKKTFKFTGGEITGEFLMSTGYLEGAHHKNCPIFSKVLKNNPTWYSN